MVRLINHLIKWWVINHLQSYQFIPIINPQLCRVLYISLMVFPFIVPPPLLAIHGIELNEAFLTD